MAFLVGSLADGPAVGAVESALRIAAVHRPLDDVVALARALKTELPTKAPAAPAAPAAAEPTAAGAGTGAAVNGAARKPVTSEESGRRGFLGGKRG